MITDKMTPLMGVLCVQWIEPSLAKYSMMLSFLVSTKTYLEVFFGDLVFMFFTFKLITPYTSSEQYICGSQSAKFMVDAMSLWYREH